MTSVDLSRDFATWAMHAGFEIFPDVGVVTIANDGGEIRYTISHENGSYALASAERAGAPRLLMTSPKLLEIELMLIDFIGDGLRSVRNLPHIFFPYGWNECARGYAVIDFGERWTGLSHFGHPMQYRIRDRDLLHPAVMFSYIADADPVELMQSYESPDGAPLLRDYVDTASRRYGTTTARPRT